VKCSPVRLDYVGRPAIDAAAEIGARWQSVIGWFSGQNERSACFRNDRTRLRARTPPANRRELGDANRETTRKGAFRLTRSDIRSADRFEIGVPAVGAPCGTRVHAHRVCTRSRRRVTKTMPPRVLTAANRSSTRSACEQIASRVSVESPHADFLRQRLC